MFVPFVEDEVEDAFGLDLALAVGLPDLHCCALVGAFLGVGLGHDDELLEGVVEVLLVVVEGRVLALLYFLVLFTDRLIRHS